jgi:hypothetical protein
MPDPTSLVSAGAASLAALLAGVNLYLSGRRERHKWAREALVEVFFTFLSASFDIGSACRRLVRARLDGAAPEELGDLVKRIDELHQVQTAALTRIRLLASGGAVESAVGLHLADHAVVDLARRTEESLAEDEFRSCRELRAYRAARDDFVLAAKKAMGIPALRPGPTLESSRH